jgi:PKD repeat protein
VLYVSFNSTGSYNVTLTASNPSGSVPLARNNYINVSTNSSAKPAVDFVAVKTMLALNETAQFVDMSANTPTKWDWTITPRTFAYTGGTDSTKQFPQVKFTASGTYTVKLVATNANGNGTLTRTNYIVIASNGNQQKIANSMVVYPNPTRGIVHISGVKPNLAVALIAADGRMINKVMDGNKLDITDLPDGIYLAKFPQNGMSCRLIKLN